jgi:acetyl/propionyl-CoA carboxylase alpha subunit
MRVVEDPDDLIRSFDAAAREALAAFGDESVYVEKYLDSPGTSRSRSWGTGGAR